MDEFSYMVSKMVLSDRQEGGMGVLEKKFRLTELTFHSKTCQNKH